MVFGFAVFTTAMLGFNSGTFTVEAGDVGGVSPAGGVAVVVAVFVNDPESTSACVTV
jgi:hypothetical protein